MGPRNGSVCFEKCNDALTLPGIEHGPTVFQRVACPLYRPSCPGYFLGMFHICCAYFQRDAGGCALFPGIKHSLILTQASLVQGVKILAYIYL